MKKILAIFLLAIFLFNYMGYFIASKVALKEAKREMRAAIRAGLIDKQMTVLITIPKKDLALYEFKDKGKEIIYKGEMYDIITRSESNTDVILKCINDRNEKKLIADLEQHIGTHVSTAAPLKSNSGKKISQSLVKLYYSEPSTIQFTRESSTAIEIPFSANFISEYIEISNPPPQLG